MKPKPKKQAPASANPWPRRLRALRERLGLTQTEAAERLKISQAQWARFESGKRQPTRPIAHLIDLLAAGKI